MKPKTGQRLKGGFDTLMQYTLQLVTEAKLLKRILLPHLR
jgi:hypothetical protein